MHVFFLLVLDHSFLLEILEVLVVVVRVWEGVVRQLLLVDACLAGQKGLHSFLFLTHLLRFACLNGGYFLVKGFDGLYYFGLEGCAFVREILEPSAQLIIDEVVAFELAGHKLNGEQRGGCFEDNHEDPSSEVENIISLEDVLLEDVAEIGSE